MKDDLRLAALREARADTDPHQGAITSFWAMAWTLKTPGQWRKRCLPDLPKMRPKWRGARREPN